MNIKISGKRSMLQEGRNFGLGFAMARVVDNDNFETVQPPSTCKDYLNDIVFVERYCKDGAKCSVYGLVYKYQGNVLDADGGGYLYIEPLGYEKDEARNESAFFSIKLEKENLHNKIGTILSVLHDFEDKMKFGKRSIAIRIDNVDCGYIFVVPQEWTTSTYMISCYSLLIRLAQYYQTSLSPIAQVLAAPGLDSTLINSLKVKIAYMLKTGTILPLNPTSWIENPSNAHNNGMASLNKDMLPIPVNVHTLSNDVFFATETTPQDSPRKMPVSPSISISPSPW